MSKEPRQKRPTLLDRVLATLARNESVFGSDIYVSYSHEYVWQANQFGHALIGLVPSLILTWLTCSPEWVLLGVVAVYCVKELIDFLIAVRLTEGVFPVRLREAAADGLADIAFVAGGALIAYTMAPVACVGRFTDLGEAVAATSLVGVGSWPALAAFVALVVFFLMVRRIYLKQKRSFDKSGMPQYVRLATFPSNFAVEPHDLPVLAARIAALALGQARTTQLIITGPAGSGRTTLGLAIGGDATTALRPVRYLSAVRLAEKAQAPFERTPAPTQPHAVAEADLVVVDELAKQVLGTDPRETLRNLVEAKWSGGITTVFQRPLAARPAGDGEPAIPAGAQPRAELPGIVWVVDHESAVPAFHAALTERFPGATIEVIRLRGPLRREMRPDS